MSAFKDGYESFVSSSGALGAFEGGAYVGRVESEISKLEENINAFKGFATKPKILKGDVAEFWHSGTHNIDAAVKGSKIRTAVDRSHNFASADITSTSGEVYGSKYLGTAIGSAKAQSKSYFEAFSKYKSETKQPNLDLKDWLKMRGFSDEDIKHDPIYLGQIRIIPKDQLEDAISFLERKIKEETGKRSDLVGRYRETLDLLTDKIKTADGAESIPLSKADAEALARLAKAGGLKSADCGLSAEELIKFKYIMEQSLQAGVTAATISMVLRVAPQVFKTIEELLETGEVSREQFEKTGFAALQGGGEGFVRGTVSSAISISCLSGHFGKALKDVDPSVIGAVTLITMNAVKNSLNLAVGKMDKHEFSDACTRDLFVTTCALSMGGVGQAAIPIPVLGYLIGSFAGSLTASFVYNAGHQTVLSFCVESGFTFFGVVDQNYELPREITESIGLRVFDYEQFEPQTFTPRAVNVSTFSARQVDLKELDIHFIRRGVIGVNRVAYV